MSAISKILTRLRAAIWAIDVRDDIANAIEQCYSDVSNPTLKTEALEAALQNKIDQGKMAALTIGDRTITAAKLALGVIPTPDATLSQSGVPADAKKVGDELGAINESLENLEPGLSDTAKAALLACFDHVAWDDDDPTGQTYITALENALYGTSARLSAVFTQGTEKYYPFDSLNSLKEHLVVTYTNGQGQSSTITNYTLSGTLTVGTARITVSYNGEVAYFNVNVEAVEIVNNRAAGVGREASTQKLYAEFGNEEITARCRFATFIKNRNYTINIVDTTKYNVAGYDVLNTTLVEYQTSYGQTLTGYEMNVSELPSWQPSWNVTGNYILCVFKKLDGTDFTASEIANAYGTIYTVS